MGLATDWLGRATRLPRVTLLLGFGLLLGRDGLDLLPEASYRVLPLVTETALLLVGFLLGGKLSLRALRQHGRAVLAISLSVLAVTFLVVAGGLWLLGLPPVAALLLGGIALATDPAATMEVVREARAKGDFVDTLQGIVAIDDAWGLIVFAIVIAICSIIAGQGESGAALLHAAYELGGSVVLGIALGIPMAWLTGRIKAGEPTLVEALGIVFLCGGLAGELALSPLLTAMVLGTTVNNLAQHHRRPFHRIEDIEWPFMILFFVLTGASVAIVPADGVLWWVLAYVVLRCIGRALGSWPGARLVEADSAQARWMGVSLLPQAGVATAMAMVGANRFPEHASLLLSLTVIATVVFELLGPVFTRSALKHCAATKASACPERTR